MKEERFGDKLREYRERNHLTQVQMGVLMNLTPGHISSLERNEKMPKPTTVQRFRSLTEAEDWQQFDVVGKLDNEEFNKYMELWQRMRRLGSVKAEAVMVTFLGILELL